MYIRHHRSVRSPLSGTEEKACAESHQRHLHTPTDVHKEPVSACVGKCEVFREAAASRVSVMCCIFGFSSVAQPRVLHSSIINK